MNAAWKYIVITNDNQEISKVYALNNNQRIINPDWEKMPPRNMRVELEKLHAQQEQKKKPKNPPTPFPPILVHKK
ncbi:hypothetical protein M9Y10_033209 [Tritrichomonas musculus]|uniref:Uncharacterized protein n=1 Tax=Tritrichomonas musculus TaxID=1915356 RepID=A0ABR2GYZ4_9EUKA